MLDELHAALAPWYPWIKALHVLAAMVWAASTAVAYAYYLKPAFRRVHFRPGASGDAARYQRMLDLHWLFFRITEPIIVIVPIVVLLAVAKPF